MKKILVLFVALGFALTSNAQKRYLDDVFEEVTVTSNIVYGTGLNSNNEQQTLALDIYEPTGDSETSRIPIIVAHGGSFLPDAGVKTDAYIVDYATAMAKKGYVVFAIAYRVGWQIATNQEQNSRNILPAAWRGIQDYKTAVRFLRKTVDQDGNPYRIDDVRIIGAGFGAGGYLPTNMMAFDVSEEVEISPELIQKDFFGNPNGTPYIDTNIQNLDGVRYASGPWSNYSYEIPFIANYSGAVPTPKVFNRGGDFPYLISVHSENDEATPYDSDVVFAAGIIPVIEVFGSFAIHNELYDRNDPDIDFFEDEDSDGYIQKRIDSDTDQDNMYKRGLLTFPNQPYMWSNEDDTYDQNYDPTYVAWMDSVVGFTAPRIHKYLAQSGVSIETFEGSEANAVMSVFPNPATDEITFKQNDLSVDIRSIEIIKIGGGTVTTFEPSDVTQTVDISDLVPGTYIVRIKAGDKQYIHRVLKQ